MALLFSEPTGSGVVGAPQLLVQGTATCPDQIVTDVRGLEDYWRRLYERQPINRIYGANRSPAGCSTGTTCGWSSR